VQGLVKEMGEAIDYVEVDANKDASAARKYHVQAVPTIVILDPGGAVVKTFVGTPGRKELRSAMEEAVSH
jgi:thioredoxin-like negative regulator of GroEL